jgi:hypothetical protein
MDSAAAGAAPATYDRIGVGYRQVRLPDPRLAALIQQALDQARTVVNVGTGTGSYEPEHAHVTAVDPSQVMLQALGVSGSGGARIWLRSTAPSVSFRSAALVSNAPGSRVPDRTAVGPWRR